MSTIKRVFSEWPGVVGPLSLLKGRPRLIHRDRLTPSIMRSYGSRLVVLDETTKLVEHCGVAVSDAFLQACGARGLAAPTAVEQPVSAETAIPETVVESPQELEAPVKTVSTPEVLTEVVEQSPADAAPVQDKPKRGRKAKSDDK